MADVKTQPTKADVLSEELVKLREENARLKAELAELKQEPEKPHLHKPEWMSEGVRADLAAKGVATDPYTGKLLTAEDEGVERDKRKEDE